jgi:uncharacterized lipoprotein YddW (UPF0748 family)
LEIKNYLIKIVSIKAILLSGLLAIASNTALATKAPMQAQETKPNPQKIIPPTPQREFRGVWIATVLNIDWPSKPGLSTQEQKVELLAILDRAAALNLNAVIFQIRPATDTLYDSPYDPWSESITGEMGKPPVPYYDPLAFAVTEAHKRGLELHAWINPYRAYHANAKSAISPNHISKTQPELVKQYGKYLWLDPGEKAVQDYTIKVIRDVVQRYDVDGIHIDDYFYPYPQRDEQGKIIDFPDEPSWQKYLSSGGKLNRSDWRRENVNTLIQRMYQTIKVQKPWVKVGISPFGVWKPGNPQQISNTDDGKAFNAYDQLYADSRKWLQKGWLDYISPQLYWRIEQTPQSYPVILNWWLAQNNQNRHIIPGLFTSRVANKSRQNWSAQEILYQIRTTRGFAGTGGHIHFSMKPLMQNNGGISDLLPQEVYAQPALIPAFPWLNNQPPGKPELRITKDKKSGNIQLNWQATGKQKAQLWVLQTKTGDEWKTNILPLQTTSYLLTNPQVENVALSAVSRYGIQGEITVGEVKENLR